MKTAEHYLRKSWRKAGQELHPNVVKHKEQNHNKAMGQLFGAIGYSFKFKLLFIYDETESEKKAVTEDATLKAH